ncbi:MAG: peptide chain release factor 1 [Bacilli bacterium]|nr:peptide chain release factor 1 [Bacilli bacterium]
MEESMRKRLEATKNRLQEIDEQLCKDDVMSDMKKFKELSKERASIEPVVEKSDKYLKLESDLEEASLMMNESDQELAELGKEEHKRILAEQSQLIDEIKIDLLPKDPNDDKNIIVEIRGAAGGDEANIFAGDLFRMYVRYAEHQGWKIQMIEENICEAGGFSLVSFMIKGDGVYSRLKFESGAHRVQRVPKTEASGRIHTSTATVLVMPEMEEIDVELKMEDIQVDTYRSQGAGGQNVNKTESAVRMTHIPTGVIVSCQTEKSQIQNREICLQMLRAKIYAKLQEEQEEKFGNERKLKVGTGERSEKIRTYNYPQNRVTDHRIGFTIQKLDRVMEGELDEILDALIHYDQEMKMAGENH